MTQIKVTAIAQIGKYQIKRRIRSTGSSDLYECFDPDLEVRVAVKLFNPKKRLLDVLPYDEENWRIRFLREARTLAMIDHPHVIAVRELSYQDNRPFYVMPFVETSLQYEMGSDYAPEELAADQQDVGPACKLSLSRSCDILFQLASGLSAFHGRGFVHRDLKPGNVLLTRLNDGLVKLCDPGLMKAPHSEESLAGYWMGTEEYLSPEQRKCAKNVDARTDVFALGVLGYRMIMGELPSGSLQPMSEEVADIPKELEELILMAMAQKKEKRPNTALEFLQKIAPIRVKIKQRGS